MKILIIKNNYLKIILMATIYFIAGKISFAISHDSTIVTIVIFMAEGFALAAVLLYGRSLWIGIFIGQFILALSSGMSVLPSAIISSINAVEAILAVVLFTKFGLNRSLSSMRDIVGLSFLIIFVLQPFSSLLGSITLLSFSLIETQEYMKSLFSWWFGNSMGQLLITPFILYLYNNYKNTTKSEFISIGLFFVVLMYLTIIYFEIKYLPLLMGLTLILVIYLTIKKGLHYSTFAIIIISFVSIYSTYIKVGLFSGEDLIQNIISLNFYILSHIVLVLFIGTIFKEKELEIHKNIEMEKKLFQSEKMAAMGEMIGNIAHQWRQPLSVISTGATGMKVQKEFGLLTDELFNNTCEVINNNAQYLSKTIDDFKNFIKGDRIKKVFSLTNSINSFLNLVNGTIKNNNIKIVLDLDNKIELNGYENELTQCFINIFNNAKDALKESTVSKDNGIIFISSSTKENNVIVKIKDNAGGISTKNLPRIFEPYFTTKHSMQGTGLGLHITYNLIVDGMEGKIEVKNINYEYQDEKYAGAEFIITLPVD